MADLANKSQNYDMTVIVDRNGNIIDPLIDDSARSQAEDLITCSSHLENDYFYCQGRCYKKIVKPFSNGSLIITFCDENPIIEQTNEKNGIDELTGLLRRKAFTDRALKYLRRQKYNPEPFAVVMADIDHFKVVNDTYGHDVGDTFLNIISQALKEELRDSDIICRWGGEEIIFILRNISLEDTMGKLDNLLQKIRSLRISYQDSYVNSPTISFGACYVSLNSEAFEDDIEGSLEVFLKESDRALYTSKDNGRDQYTVINLNNNKPFVHANLSLAKGRRSADVTS